MGELIAILLILFFTIKDWNKPKDPPKYRGHVYLLSFFIYIPSLIFGLNNHSIQYGNQRKSNRRGTG